MKKTQMIEAAKKYRFNAVTLYISQILVLNAWLFFQRSLGKISNMLITFLSLKDFIRWPFLNPNFVGSFHNLGGGDSSISAVKL